MFVFVFTTNKTLIFRCRISYKSKIEKFKYLRVKDKNTMVIKTKIFKPKSYLNELENRYKVVIWKNGSPMRIRFADTKSQALEVQKRLKKQFK